MAVKLTAAHRAALERAQAKCGECLIDIEMAREAGVDLGQLPAIRDQVEERIRGLLRTYWPGSPASTQRR